LFSLLLPTAYSNCQVPLNINVKEMDGLLSLFTQVPLNINVKEMDGLQIYSFEIKLHVEKATSLISLACFVVFVRCTEAF
jgi:hypothetical protein